MKPAVQVSNSLILSNTGSSGFTQVISLKKALYIVSDRELALLVCGYRWFSRRSWWRISLELLSLLAISGSVFGGDDPGEAEGGLYIAVVDKVDDIRFVILLLVFGYILIYLRQSLLMQRAHHHDVVRGAKSDSSASSRA